MSRTLPKPYLSYSAINLWCKDKEMFRARYYRGEKMPDTPFTLFGKEIHEKIENNNDFAGVPQHAQSEIELATTVDGVVVLGYIDSFCPNTTNFIDYKSGIRDKYGAARWNEVEVQKLDQLPFYSLLIEENYKDTPKDHPCQLVWLETQWKKEEYDFDGIQLSGQSGELELTGHYEIFDRVIEPWERDRIRTWISEKADEISEDYRSYLAVH